MGREMPTAAVWRRGTHPLAMVGGTSGARVLLAVGGTIAARVRTAVETVAGLAMATRAGTSALAMALTALALRDTMVLHFKHERVNYCGVHILVTDNTGEGWPICRQTPKTKRNSPETPARPSFDT